MAESRDDRIERYYSESARDLAEMLVDAQDEAARLRLAWRSSRRRASRAMGAWRYVTWRVDAQSEEMRKHDDFAHWLWNTLTERRRERDRYRSAWLSARRRAADEANFGLEALERERARQSAFLTELRPLQRKRMDDLRRLRAYADEIRIILGWTHVDDNWRTHHLPAISEARHELDEAQREERPFVPRIQRRVARGEFADVIDASEEA